METEKKSASHKLGLNMRILRHSRKPVRPGDIFVLKVLPDEFHFGRVIRTDVNMMGENVLVYIYRTTSPLKHQIPALNKQDLLIPPLIVGKFMWTKGYFESVSNQRIVQEDVHPVHCFSRPSLLDPTKVKYFNEDGKELKQRVEPCGIRGLSLEGAVDDEVSDALGIPRCAASLEDDVRRAETMKKSQASRKRGLQHLAKTAKGREILRKMGISKDEYM